MNPPGSAAMFEAKTSVLVGTAVKMRLPMMVSKHLGATPSPLYLDSNLPNDRLHKTIYILVELIDFYFSSKNQVISSCGK